MAAEWVGQAGPDYAGFLARYLDAANAMEKDRGLDVQLDRVAQTTEFNGAKLLDGSFGTQQFQVGANANQTIVAATANLRTSVYGNNQNVSSAGAGVSAAAAATSIPANGVTSGAVSISGSLGTATLNVASSSTAKTIADQINAVKANSGVTATARTEVELDIAAVAGSFTLAIKADNTTPITASRAGAR